VDVGLSRLWNGESAPAGTGGTVSLRIEHAHLVWSWDLALAGAPRVPGEPVGYLDGLWGFDVVELFVTGRADRTRYVELEVGPSGHWLALAFDGVRRRSSELADLPLVSSHDLHGGRWRGRALVPVAPLEKHAGPRPWKGLVAAVLGAGAPGVRSFLTSVALPGDQPDIHQPAAWGPLAP
jgi:hypothetical protein